MSDKVGTRAAGPPTVAARPLAEMTDSGAATPHGPQAGSGAKAHPVRDGFERQAATLAGGPLKSQIEALASRGMGGKIQFSSEDLAFLANTFAALLRQHPKASRSKRAKLFTKAILRRHKRLGKVMEKVPEKDAEALFDSIADALDSSPVFAQMIENVTEEAGKLNS